MDIDKRIRMAAESMLENESIREGLDDDGASILLDWATTCAARIASETADLEDDDEADELMYPRMRALRQMLDMSKTLLNPEVSRAEGLALLAEILQHAELVYGAESIPEGIEWDEAVTQRSVAALRDLIEKNVNTKG